MAHTGLKSFLLLIFLHFFFMTTAHAGKGTETTQRFAKRVPMKLKEKMSHLHFYFHDNVSGDNPTAMPVVMPPFKTVPWAFGLVTMMDDLLTEGPDPASKPVGRAQGFYASAALDELGFLMAMNLVFTEGKYNGSVLSVLGRNPPLRLVREMPVVGGSGLFRFARGFALAHTHWFNGTSGDAIVEYNVYVIHY